MNRIFIVGNITGDIYYDRLLIKSEKRPFLRLILMSSRPRFVGGMRVVLWDEMAELFFPYLQRGSEIAVIGHLQTREHRAKLVHEIEATNLILLRKVNWEFGEQERLRRNVGKPPASANNVFVIGELGDDIYFDRFERARGEGSYAFLRLVLTNDEYLNGLRIIVLGALAELAYPFLRKGSKVAVDGHIQTRDRETGKKVVEVTAEHIAFLENINWAAGEAAQESRAAQAALED